MEMTTAPGKASRDPDVSLLDCTAVFQTNPVGPGDLGFRISLNSARVKKDMSVTDQKRLRETVSHSLARLLHARHGEYMASLPALPSIRLRYQVDLDPADYFLQEDVRDLSSIPEPDESGWSDGDQVYSFEVDLKGADGQPTTRAKFLFDWKGDRSAWSDLISKTEKLLLTATIGTATYACTTVAGSGLTGSALVFGSMLLDAYGIYQSLDTLTFMATHLKDLRGHTPDDAAAAEARKQAQLDSLIPLDTTYTEV